MKISIDLPDELLRRAKIVAAQRKATLEELVIEGLNWATSAEAVSVGGKAPLRRLRAGLHLGGSPLSRQQAHEG